MLTRTIVIVARRLLLHELLRALALLRVHSVIYTTLIMLVVQELTVDRVCVCVHVLLLVRQLRLARIVMCSDGSLRASDQDVLVALAVAAVQHNVARSDCVLPVVHHVDVGRIDSFSALSLISLLCIVCGTNFVAWEALLVCSRFIIIVDA